MVAERKPGRNASHRPSSGLHAAVEAAVARGTLLRLRIEDEQGESDYLFMNTPQGRRAVAQVREGETVAGTGGLCA